MNLRVENLPNYPKTGEHVGLIGHDLPYEITKGEDQWWYKNKDGKEVGSQRKLWYVHSYETSDFPVQTKGFKTWQAALKYAIKEYRKWLRSQKALCDEVKKAMESA